MSIWSRKYKYSTGTIVLYCKHIAPRHIASFATVATAKKETAATSKIKGILYGACVKATWALRAAPLVVLRRSIEPIS